MYLNDNGYVEIGMQKLIDIMKDLEFGKQPIVSVTTDKGFISIKQLRTFSFTENHLADFLWDFSERVLNCKKPKDVKELIERTINDQDN